jgi:hypothetical protein
LATSKLEQRLPNTLIGVVLVRFLKLEPAAAADSLACVFSDGSTLNGTMTRQGVLPHEAFHFVVERTLGWHDGFFGQVAQGASPDVLMAKLHDANIDRAKNIQALQSESLIECLQSEQWGGTVDPATFAHNLIIACRRHGVPPPDITAEEIAAVRTALREFGAAWRPLPTGGVLERTF